MSNKKFILNADDFGMSNAFNKAVVDGYHLGLLKSTSICANGEAFDAAVHDILPECPNLSMGIHLNIIEGFSLIDHEKFTNSYLQMIYLANDSSFLAKVEKELRAQIEKVLNYKKADHLDSHVHVHAIPQIFELVCKLAKEYEINQVRTQFEKFYFVPDITKHLNLNYPPNVIKVLLLNSFTMKNKETIKQYGLQTNDYILGVGYTSMMDDKTIYHGLSNIKDDNVTVEAIIHPCNFMNPRLNNHPRQKEFLITQNMDLKDKIQRLGFDIGNYCNCKV